MEPQTASAAIDLPVPSSAPPEAPPVADKPKKLRRKPAYEAIKSGIAMSRTARLESLKNWQDNVAYRIGRPFTTDPTDDTINVPADWARTKNKTAKLFFQVPEIKARARDPKYVKTAPLYAAAVNFELQYKIKTHFTVDECLGDAINAAGIAFAFVGYEATFEDVEVPAIDIKGLDPEMVEYAIAHKLIPTAMMKRPVYEGRFVDRISPARMLRPVEFKGSDWSKAPWLGFDAYMPLAEAVRLGWVGEDYEGDEITVDELLAEEETGNRTLAPGSYVRYTSIFYYASKFDPAVKHPHAIRRMVIVDGIQRDEPVIDEPFKWQKWVPGTPKPDGSGTTKGHFLGMTSLPIKVLTLTSVSDTAIPPSDSEMGRPQVKEMIRSRSQMIRQREHSLPIRWYDVNMVDEEISQLLRSGQVQDMIPMNGPGDHAIGEVARANYPHENFDFMRIFNTDLDETWSMGANQQGFEQPGDTSATEAKIIQSSNDIRLDYERARVLRFFLDIAEGVGALMQMFCDEDEWVEVLGEQAIPVFQIWNSQLIRGDMIFECKPDAAVKVDVGQKRAEILNVYKLVRKDPLINPQAPILELLELHGYDVSRWFVPPSPPKPTPPKASYTFKGEDLLNPFVIALIQKTDTPVTSEELEAAKAILASFLSVVPQVATALPAAAGEPPAQQGPPTGTTQPHPGPPPTVQPLNRRYERADNRVEDASGQV